MANSIDLSGLGKYVDQLSSALVRESVLGGVTQEYITVLPNIKYADALNKITSNLTAQAGGCGIISPTGSVAVQQNTIQVNNIKIEEAICLEDIEQYWLGMSMKAGANQESFGPADFAAVYSADKQAKVAALVEDLLWKGSAANHYSTDPNLTLTTGFLELLEYTSATNSVVSGNGTFSTNVTMTPNNAIAIIDSMVSAMNTSASQILTEEDLTIFISFADFNALVIALRQANYFHFTVGQEETGAQRWNFNWPGTNIKVVATRGLNNTNKRLLTDAHNLVMGTDLVSDFQTFRIWWEPLYDQVFFRNKLRLGTGIYYFQNIVLFK